ncbi:NAD(P)-dependent oxidoreductase [Amycolatopsis sp. cg9]|uniref:NAD(P)-dependent oxidoreductase n=1 Tax=Amycolatopsis sp. cg9 TaxID=3238801 RepID=UPI003523DC7B
MIPRQRPHLLGSCAGQQRHHDVGAHRRRLRRGEYGFGLRERERLRRPAGPLAGAIGGEVARRLEVFGVDSTLVASRGRDGVLGADVLPEVVSGHAIVVITAPLTEKTRGLVGPRFLKLMDDNALLVNAGRGQIVDTDALLAELVSGRLRAALDVTDPEPLPNDHPLWRQEGAVISPHSARTVPGTNRLCYEVAAEQVAAFLRGERPTNAVEHG